MKVTSERLPNSQVLLNIEVDQETLDKSVERAYRRLVNQVAIPGFRRGKAPRHLVERYVGKEALLQEGVEQLIPDVYRRAVEEAGIQPVDQPEFNIAQMEPLVIKATVPVEPAVELGDYHSTSLAPVEVAIGEQQVSDLIERMREQHAEWVPVERPVREGDRVTVDVEAITGIPTFYTASGEPMLQLGGGQRVLSETGMELEVEREGKTPVPGFALELIGIAPGSEKKFQLTLPQEFENKEAAGKNAIFRVVVHAVKEKSVPALDDEFAKTVGEFETLDALRADIRERLQAGLRQEASRHFENAVIQAAVDRSRVELPPSLVERELDRMLDELKATLSAQNVSMEEYLSVTGRANEEELHSQLRPEAERRVRTYFTLNAIGRAEGIEVSPEEIEQEIDSIAGQVAEASDRMRSLLSEPKARENLALRLWNQKVIDRLKAIATGNTEAEQTEGSVEGSEPALEPAKPPAEAESQGNS